LFACLVTLCFLFPGAGYKNVGVFFLFFPSLTTMHTRFLGPHRIYAFPPSFGLLLSRRHAVSPLLFRAETTFFFLCEEMRIVCLSCLRDASLKIPHSPAPHHILLVFTQTPYTIYFTPTSLFFADSGFFLFPFSHARSFRAFFSRENDNPQLCRRPRFSPRLDPRISSFSASLFFSLRFWSAPKFFGFITAEDLLPFFFSGPCSPLKGERDPPNNIVHAFVFPFSLARFAPRSIYPSFSFTSQACLRRGRIFSSCVSGEHLHSPLFFLYPMTPEKFFFDFSRVFFFSPPTRVVTGHLFEQIEVLVPSTRTNGSLVLFFFLCLGLQWCIS